MTKRVIRVVVILLFGIVVLGCTRQTFAQSNLVTLALPSPKPSDTFTSTLKLENSSATPKPTPKEKPDGPPVPPKPKVTWTAIEPSATSSSSLNPDVIFNLINQYRASINLPSFQKDARLCSIAQARIPQLPAEATNGNYHAGLYAMNLPYWITENMKFGSDEAGTVNWWLHSPIHHAAIVSDNTYSCGACTGTICVEEFTSYVPK